MPFMETLLLGLILTCMPHGLLADLVAHKSSDGLLETYPLEYRKCSHYNTPIFVSQGAECKIRHNATETGEAVLEEMPHVAMITTSFSDVNMLCGGALISENYVLTSGHCAEIIHEYLQLNSMNKSMNDSALRSFFKRSPFLVANVVTGHVTRNNEFHVRLGEVNKDFGKEEADNSTTQIIKISEAILHPKFRMTEEGAVGQFAVGLLRLSRPAEFNTYVRPACLHTRNTPIDNVTLIGSHWSKDQDNKERVQLRRLKSRRELYYQCKEDYLQLEKPCETYRGICVVSERDSFCGDDTANMLQLKSNAPYCTYQIVGFSGTAGCQNLIHPQSVYFTPIAPLRSWINSVVWPYEIGA